MLLCDIPKPLQDLKMLQEVTEEYVKEITAKLANSIFLMKVYKCCYRHNFCQEFFLKNTFFDLEKISEKNFHISFLKN